MVWPWFELRLGLDFVTCWLQKVLAESTTRSMRVSGSEIEQTLKMIPPDYSYSINSKYELAFWNHVSCIMWCKCIFAKQYHMIHKWKPHLSMLHTVCISRKFNPTTEDQFAKSVEKLINTVTISTPEPFKFVCRPPIFTTCLILYTLIINVYVYMRCVTNCIIHLLGTHSQLYSRLTRSMKGRVI